MLWKKKRFLLSSPREEMCFLHPPLDETSCFAETADRPLPYESSFGEGFSLEGEGVVCQDARFTTPTVEFTSAESSEGDREFSGKRLC